MEITIPTSSGRLAQARAEAMARIDAAAERVRARYITPGAGQAMTYLQKGEEARDVIANGAGDPGTHPLLETEAAATGVTVEALAGVVIANAEAWKAKGGEIEAARLGGKAAIRAAASAPDIDAALAAALAGITAL